MNLAEFAAGARLGALEGQFTLESLLTGAVLGHLVCLVWPGGGVLPVRRSRRGRAPCALPGLSSVADRKRQHPDSHRRHSGIRQRMRPGVIRMPLDVTTEGDSVVAAMINITPGQCDLASPTTAG